MYFDSLLPTFRLMSLPWHPLFFYLLVYNPFFTCGLLSYLLFAANAPPNSIEHLI